VGDGPLFRISHNIHWSLHDALLFGNHSSELGDHNLYCSDTLWSPSDGDCGFHQGFPEPGLGRHVREGDQVTDVTIRGIDDSVYSLFSAEARRRSTPIGELVTQVMRIFLEETSEKRFTIEGQDELTLTRDELESVGGPIGFNGIKVLTISDDVDWELFDKYVDEIRKSKTVIIPDSLTKLQVLTKCRNVDKIVKDKLKQK